MAAIKIDNLTKRFKHLTAVDTINVSIDVGECIGLLGPNGAGKTTLIRMITAVSPPSEGHIQVLGYDLDLNPREAKARLGVIPQHDNLDPDLKVLSNLTTFARYFDIPAREAARRSLEVLHFFELTDKRNSSIAELSGGMKRRLLIARGLINKPSILVLDEPTTGLDPHAKYLVWQKLTELKTQNITQILCTQNMEEAAYLCDRVAIMDQGKVLSMDKPDKLITQYVGEDVWEIWLNHENRERIVSGLQASNCEFRELGGKIDIFNSISPEYLRGLLNNPDKLRQRPANLEDVFLKLTGRSLEA